MACEREESALAPVAAVDLAQNTGLKVKKRSGRNDNTVLKQKSIVECTIQNELDADRGVSICLAASPGDIARIHCI